MDMFVFIIGFLGLIVSLVMMVINLIKKRSKKKPLIALLISIILTFTGLLMPASDMQEKNNELGVEKSTKNNEVNEEVEDVEEKSVEVSNEEGEDTEEIEVETRESSLGKSNKDFTEITDSNPGKVREDNTEKWRKITIATTEDINEYLLSYNELYMTEETTVHSIINFTNNTTTMINDFGSYLSVRIHEYVNKEEHDANKLGSGMLLTEYQIYKDNGDIVKID